MAFYSDGREVYFSWFLDLSNLPSKLMSPLRDWAKICIVWINFLTILSLILLTVQFVFVIAAIFFGNAQKFIFYSIEVFVASVFMLALFAIFIFFVQMKNARNIKSIACPKPSLMVVLSLKFYVIWVATSLGACLSLANLGMAEGFDIDVVGIIFAMGAIFIWMASRIVSIYMKILSPVS